MHYAAVGLDKIIRNFRSMEHIQQLKMMIGKDIHWVGWMDGCRTFDCEYAIVCCSTNRLLSVNMDNSSFIINSKQNIGLNARTNVLLTERCLMCKLEIQLRCEFWAAVPRYGNAYSIGKRMSKWIMPFWCAFKSTVNPVCNDSDMRTVVIDQTYNGKLKDTQHAREKERESETKEFHSHLTGRFSFRRTI